MLESHVVAGIEPFTVSIIGMSNTILYLVVVHLLFIVYIGHRTCDFFTVHTF